jgi:hypothetical protein
MEFVCYADWNQLPESVNHLFAQAEKESVFFSRPWFENLLANGLEEGRSLLLACVLDGEEVLALLPLSQREGAHYHSLKHLYSSLSTLLLQEHRRQDILTCLAEGLRRQPVNYLQIDPIAEHDPNLHGLQQAMESAGYTCQRYFRFYNWFYPTRDRTFAEYLAERPSRVRNTIGRKQRKLAREHGYRVQLFSAGDLARGLTDYQAVYNASWKAHEQFDSFVEGLAQSLASQDWLRLAVLYIDDLPAAAQFWFVVHGKASIFKLVYDEQWKHYSPGTILTAYLMEHVIDVDKVEQIDFLTGNDAYKQEWMSERRERWRLCCFSSKPEKSPDAGLFPPFGALLKRLKGTVYN